MLTLFFFARTLLFCFPELLNLVFVSLFFTILVVSFLTSSSKLSSYSDFSVKSLFWLDNSFITSPNKLCATTSILILSTNGLSKAAWYSCHCYHSPLFFFSSRTFWSSVAIQENSGPIDKTKTIKYSVFLSVKKMNGVNEIDTFNKLLSVDVIWFLIAD